MLLPKRIACSAALLLTLVMPAAFAQQAPASPAKVDELFSAMHMSDTYDRLMKQVLAQTDQMSKRMFPQQNLTEAQKKQMADFQQKTTAIVQASLSWSALKPDYQKLYADNYTNQELDGIIAFYKSPTGQTMLNKTPVLMQQSSSIVNAHMQEVEPKLRALMEDMQKQAQPATGTAPAPSAK